MGDKKPDDGSDDGDRPPAALRWVLGVGAGSLTLLGLVWVLDIVPMLGFSVYQEQLRALALGLGIALVFLHFPAGRGRRVRLPWYDVLFAVLGLGTMVHVVANYDRLLIEMAHRTTETFVIGIIVVGLVLEGLRRATGWALVIVAGAFIVYALVADLVPGDLQGRPISIDQLLIYLALDTNAVLGAPMQVGPTVVLVFILMGQLLFAAGGGSFFTDLAMSSVGNSRGGAAKIAVVASGLFGSISGTAISNVASTGVITIPLMRKSGYDAVTAGAIEAVASTGGQLMPPIMGAAAFLMAEILEIPYTDVIIAAALPALLYYIAVFIHVDLIAGRERIRVVDEVLPTARVVLKGGWHFLIPFAVLLYALFELLEDAEVAAIYASVTILILGPLRGYSGQRLTPRAIIKAAVDTGLIMIELFMILATAGFVIGILNVSGLGFALTLFLLNVGGNSVLFLLVIAAIVCILLGMGMPTIGVYILLATLVAPAIVEAGVPAIAAHLFILYFGMMSMITPPIAMAAFAASTISRANPMSTGWVSMKLGWVAYIIPFLFALSPSLILQGEMPEIATGFVTALIGVYFVTVAVAGYFMRHLGVVMRVMLAAAGLMTMTPASLAGRNGTLIDLAGAAIGAALLAYEFFAGRRARAEVSP